jgi:hypothetical protein
MKRSLSKFQSVNLRMIPLKDIKKKNRYLMKIRNLYPQSNMEALKNSKKKFQNKIFHNVMITASFIIQDRLLADYALRKKKNYSKITRKFKTLEMIRVVILKPHKTLLLIMNSSEKSMVST